MAPIERARPVSRRLGRGSPAPPAPRSAPPTQYDFRPGPTGRSLGEMAWHLCEIQGYTSYGITKGAVAFQEAPPNLQRPRKERKLAPGYRRVHQEAVARLADLTEAQIDREMPFADQRMAVRDMLWGAILMHLIHHRGQRSLMCRLAGGASPGIYGPRPGGDGGDAGEDAVGEGVSLLSPSA